MKNCHNCPHHQEGDYCDRFGRFIDPDHPIEVVAIEGYRIDVVETSDNRFENQ